MHGVDVSITAEDYLPLRHRIAGICIVVSPAIVLPKIDTSTLCSRQCGTALCRGSELIDAVYRYTACRTVVLDS